MADKKPKTKDKDTTKFPDRPDDKYFPDQEKTIAPPAEPTKKFARGGGVERKGKTRGRFV